MSLKTPQHSHRLLKNGKVRPFNVPRKSKEEIKPFQSYPNLTLSKARLLFQISKCHHVQINKERLSL